MFSNKENLIPLVKFNYINPCKPIENFRLEFILIVRAFLFGSSKNIKSLSRFHLVVYFLITHNLHFFLECGVNPRFLILLVLIFTDKGSRSSMCKISLIFVRLTLVLLTSLSFAYKFIYFLSFLSSFIESSFLFFNIVLFVFSFSPS